MVSRKSFSCAWKHVLVDYAVSSCYLCACQCTCLHEAGAPTVVLGAAGPFSRKHVHAINQDRCNSALHWPSVLCMCVRLNVLKGLSVYPSLLPRVNVLEAGVQCEAQPSGPLQSEPFFCVQVSGKFGVIRRKAGAHHRATAVRAPATFLASCWNAAALGWS